MVAEASDKGGCVVAVRATKQEALPPRDAWLPTKRTGAGLALNAIISSKPADTIRSTSVLDVCMFPQTVRAKVATTVQAR